MVLLSLRVTQKALLLPVLFFFIFFFGLVPIFGRTVKVVFVNFTRFINQERETNTGLVLLNTLKKFA